MSDYGSDRLPNDTHVPMAQLPATALQALYHAVTGKTENLSKRLTKNVLIRRDDINRLVDMLRQQMQHYVISAGPTTTVKLAYDNKRTQQFSSWERFSIQDSATMDISSELLIKHEFLLLLPETQTPQRCVINITIDSKLPLYSHEEDDFDLPVWLMLRFHTVLVSIDFVDYLIAKVFCQIAEDWFDTLEELKPSPWISKLAKKPIDWEFIFDRIGWIGLAGFILTFLYDRGGKIESLGVLTYLSAIGIILVSFTTTATRYLGARFSRIVHLSTLPSMLILTRGDEVRSAKVISEAGNSLRKALLYTSGALFSLAINIFASFLYSRLTK